MPRYVFILGHQPHVSLAELTAVLPEARVVDYAWADSYAVLDMAEANCQALMNRLGGTVKIGMAVEQPLDARALADFLNGSQAAGKIVFGLSFYDPGQRREYANFGLEIKKHLKALKRSCRYVAARTGTLSSVAVAKNKCLEILVLPKLIAVTCAVQDFEEYSSRDYDRPGRNAKSGMLPPKLSKIMINLSGAGPADTLLDPFCGSGTVLQEAMVLGFRHVIGSDASGAAVAETKQNLDWLCQRSKLPNTDFRVIQCDARQIAERLKSVDVIVTEPYLGPALRGGLAPVELERVMRELSELYTAALRAFYKILTPQGRIVMIFPAFQVGAKKIHLEVKKIVGAAKFKSVREPLEYQRAGQRVIRGIYVLEKV